MVRLRRLPPTRVLRRPVYEVDFAGSSADGNVTTTTTPATLIDTRIGVTEAWDLVAAADAAWTGGTGPWVSHDGGVPAAPDADPEGNPLAGRSFQLWEYNAGRGGLLIRSPRGAGSDSNVDLIFDQVEYLACPQSLPDLALVHAEDDDQARAGAALGIETVPGRVFVLLSQGQRHLVVAASCRVIEHVGDPLASPFQPVRFGKDWWADVFSPRS